MNTADQPLRSRKGQSRIAFVREHYPQVLVTEPDEIETFVINHSDHGGADVASVQRTSIQFS